ncbi:MAG: DUF2924 domain-containing protein [Acidobacteriaceae bacterium]
MRQQKIAQQLAQLPTMKRQELQSLWQNLFGRQPSSRLRRETLVPILGYRIQGKACGGLKESLARKLHALAEDGSTGRKPVVHSMLRPKIGTRFIREWNGRLHEITVLENGYEYDNHTYRSLSEIAHLITGTKWSGPDFFGTKRTSRKAIA